MPPPRVEAPVVVRSRRGAVVEIRRGEGGADEDQRRSLDRPAAAHRVGDVGEGAAQRRAPPARRRGRPPRPGIAARRTGASSATTRRWRGSTGGSPASRRCAAKAASVSRRRHRRGAAGGAGQHHGLGHPRQGQLARERSRGGGEGGHAGRQACRECRAPRAAGSARRRALQIDRSPDCRRATSWPAAWACAHLRDDRVEVEGRGVDDARARRAPGEDLAAARGSPHRGRPGSSRRARGRARVMRSGAPGPAPMKCTVMRASPSARWRRWRRAEAMRGRTRRAPACRRRRAPPPRRRSRRRAARRPAPRRVGTAGAAAASGSRRSAASAGRPRRSAASRKPVSPARSATVASAQAGGAAAGRRGERARDQRRRSPRGLAAVPECRGPRRSSA